MDFQRMVVDYYATDKTPLLDRVKGPRRCATQLRHNGSIYRDGEGAGTGIAELTGRYQVALNVHAKSNPKRLTLALRFSRPRILVTKIVDCINNASVKQPSGEVVRPTTKGNK
jgi:hypothetical protein